MGTALVIWSVGFFRNIGGLVTRPYETVRRVVDHEKPGELVIVGAFLALYFAIASLVRVSSFRPFLLTREFIELVLATSTTYGLAVLLFWVAGELVGAKGKPRGLAVAWGYTLIPTLVWFFATSLLYVILPPPRTTSAQGVLFSLLFLIFSAALFFWKATLAYLTLRFGLRLTLGKILVVLGITLPILAAYSIGMYRIGIFRIPFI